MNKLLNYLMFVLTLLLFSCGEMISERDAIKINQQGIDLMNSGKYEEALRAFLKAVNSPRLSKDSKGTIYRNIALTYNGLVKKDSAVHFSTLAAKCYRKNSFYYLVNLADVDILTGKISNALARLLKAKKINTDEMSVNNSLGLIYLGEYDESVADLDKALIYNSRAFELNSGRVTEEVLGRTYYKMENYEKAEYHYEHLVKNYPDILSYSMDIGMIKIKLKKNEEADKLFEKLIAKDSSYKETINVFIAANKGNNNN
jgi:tetratricopeptide (TPR) repeat protein